MRQTMTSYNASSSTKTSYRLALLSLLLLHQRNVVAFTASTATTTRSHNKPLTSVVSTCSTIDSSHLYTRRYAFQPLKYQDYVYDDQKVYYQEAVTAAVNNNRDQALLSASAALKRKAIPSAVNKRMIETVCTAQVAVLSFCVLLTLLTGQTEHVLEWISPPSVASTGVFSLPLIMLQGAFTALPLIMMETVIAESSKHSASRVNVGTVNTVLELFGRRQKQENQQQQITIINNKLESHPTTENTTALSQVVSWSFLLSAVTAVSEQLVYFGMLPVLISSAIGVTSLPLLVLLQAATYSIMHLSPQSSAEDNKVVASLQGLNGLWYSLAFLFTGGNVLPCIFGHLFYNMHTFVETWHETNNQLDYVEQEHMLSNSEKQGVMLLQQESNHALSKETLIYARRLFLSFDKDQVGKLSLPDVQRAVAYAFWSTTSNQNGSSTAAPEESQVEKLFDTVISGRIYKGPRRLSFDEFLRVLFALKSQMTSKKCQQQKPQML